MNWLPISTSARTSPEFIGSEPTARATWLCLMLYCAEHETGGVIRDCASWGDRRWMQTVGCTKHEALLQTDLYRFRKNDLVLWGYDPRYEEVIRKKRLGGAIGGKLSGAARSAKHESTPLKDSFKDSFMDSLNGGERRGEEGRGRDLKPVPEEAGLGTGDKYEKIRSIPQADLAQWAVNFCGDKLDWVRVYKSYISVIGPEAFRSILEQFVGEVYSGEDCRNRGAALVVRVKRAVDDKRKGGTK